ncbi:hypothetical protein GCM10027514_09900 [Azotobacter armeniacus]
MAHPSKARAHGRRRLRQIRSRSGAWPAQRRYRQERRFPLPPPLTFTALRRSPNVGHAPVIPCRFGESGRSNAVSAKGDAADDIGGY